MFLSSGKQTQEQFSLAFQNQAVLKVLVQPEAICESIHCIFSGNLFPYTIPHHTLYSQSPPLSVLELEPLLCCMPAEFPPHLPLWALPSSLASPMSIQAELCI